MTHAQKIASIALTLVLGLGIVTPAFAKEPQNARGVKKNFMQELREQMSSRAGVAKTFFEFGRAAIGSGKITAKTDTTLTVEKDGKSYTVNITEKTQLRRRFWGKATLGEFSVGNEVTVVGRWTDDTHATINAVLIRNLSIQKRFGVFFGKVKSLLSNGWVMSTVSDKRADQTVTVSAETKFVNRRGETITQADVKVDHRVRVRGLWDRSLNTVTEVKEVKDFNLPILPSTTPTP